MIIKKKSLVVALISSFIISSVSILTIAAYVIYTEIKSEDFKKRYFILLQKANARVYSKHIDASKLNVRIGTAGALRKKPVIEGIIKNNGPRIVRGILMKIRFLDRDGAVIYDIVFRPQEPPLGTHGVTKVTIPYLYNPPKTVLKPGEALPFKTILSSCPREIFVALRDETARSNGPGRWSGRFDYEILSIDF